MCVIVEHPAIGSNPDKSSRRQNQNTVFKFCFQIYILLFPRYPYVFFSQKHQNQLWGSRRFFVERVAGTPPEENQPGCEADQFLLSSSEVKNV